MKSLFSCLRGCVLGRNPFFCAIHSQNHVIHKKIATFFTKCFAVNEKWFNIASTFKNNKTMDIIFLIIGTPITIAVMYGAHCIKLNTKRFNQMPEAKPYEFERDEYIPEFNEFTQMLHQRRMYKGRADK